MSFEPKIPQEDGGDDYKEYGFEVVVIRVAVQCVFHPFPPDLDPLLPKFQTLDAVHTIPLKVRSRVHLSRWVVVLVEVRPERVVAAA